MISTGIVVLLFACIQCIFGMGLLVFGTPTLLILGYDFSTALGILLPPSIVISALQVIDSGKFDKSELHNCFKFCVPMIVIFLFVSLKWGSGEVIPYVVAFFLLLTSIIRFSTSLRIRCSAFLKKYQRVYLMLMGGVHGLSNMGGGLLSVYATTKHEKKDDILRTVSIFYLVFGSFQLFVLGVMASSDLFLYQSIIYMLFSFLIYKLIGKKLILYFNDRNYQNLFSVFMLIYSIILVTN